MIEIDVTGRVERLMESGMHRDRAIQQAKREAAATLFRAMNSGSSEIEQLADRVHTGGATLVQLADKIAEVRGTDRERAFGEAERMVMASTRGEAADARVNAASGLARVLLDAAGSPLLTNVIATNCLIPRA